MSSKVRVEKLRADIPGSSTSPVAGTSVTYVRNSTMTLRDFCVKIHITNPP